MKITYLHQHFRLPSMGGATRSYEMSKRLAGFGHEVHLLTGRPVGEGEGEGQTTIDGVNVHWLKTAYDHGMTSHRRLASFASYAARGYIDARAQETDLVLASSTPLTASIPGVKTARRSSAPFVFEVRDLWPRVAIAMGELPKGLGYMAGQLEEWAYKNADAVVCLSRDVADVLVSRGVKCRIEVIPNGCDLELFSEENGVDPLERVPGLGGRPILLYPGTLGRVNNPKYLVDVAQALRKCGSDVAVVCLGRGREGQHAISYARELGLTGRSIFFVPPVSKHAAVAAFRRSTAVISTVAPVPELAWNSANKVFDALAAGRPVFVNHGGWLSSVLQSSGCGVRLSSTDAQGAALMIDEVISNSELVGTMASSARRLAEREFDRDLLARNLNGLLEDVAS